MRERLVDQGCATLAKHFLLTTIAPGHMILSKERIERDTISLAEAIQEAVEQWFSDNPIEEEQAP